MNMHSCQSVKIGQKRKVDQGQTQGTAFNSEDRNKRYVLQQPTSEQQCNLCARNFECNNQPAGDWSTDTHTANGTNRIADISVGSFRSHTALNSFHTIIIIQFSSNFIERGQNTHLFSDSQFIHTIPNVSCCLPIFRYPSTGNFAGICRRQESYWIVAALSRDARMWLLCEFKWFTRTMNAAHRLNLFIYEFIVYFP